MKYNVHSIIFDTEGEEIDGLPTKMTIDVDDDITDKDEVIEIISDEISNRTGWCHKGFLVEEIDE